VADPWTDDLAALAEHSRHGLRSLAVTRASLTKEPKMRFHRAHPAFAALIALLVIGVTAPLAYAVVRHVLVTVDPDQSTDQIEKNVTDQLNAAGVTATVKAAKPDDGPLQIRIQTSDEALGSDLAVQVGDHTVSAQTGRGIRVACASCDDATQAAVAQAVSSDAVIDVVEDDAAVGPAIKQALADKGYTHVDVTVAPDAIAVTVHASPP
jgi:hypothetical protein